MLLITALTAVSLAAVSPAASAQQPYRGRVIYSSAVDPSTGVSTYYYYAPGTQVTTYSYSIPATPFGTYDLGGPPRNYGPGYTYSYSPAYQNRGSFSPYQSTSGGFFSPYYRPPNYWRP